jgi:methionyl-tRNA formyltransferase
MNLAFAGTPEFAARSLAALLSSRHRVVLVLTREDASGGRGMALRASPVKVLASEHGLPVRQPRSLKEPGEHEALRAAGIDALVVAAYGLILPQAVLDIPRLGAINVHASLLPRWRGAAPIQRALLAGDRETGISIMQMEAGLDTGPVLLAAATPIQERDTAGSLHDRLADLGAGLLVRALDEAEAGRLVPQPQDARLATYASKLEKSEARIRWASPAREIDRQVRAFNPAPGCSATLRGVTLKVRAAHPLAREHGRPGEVLEASDTGIVVACGEGALCLDEIQRPGARSLCCAEFLRGFPVRAGECFDA